MPASGYGVEQNVGIVGAASVVQPAARTGHWQRRGACGSRRRGSNSSSLRGSGAGRNAAISRSHDEKSRTHDRIAVPRHIARKEDNVPAATSNKQVFETVIAA